MLRATDFRAGLPVTEPLALLTARTLMPRPLPFLHTDVTTGGGVPRSIGTMPGRSGDAGRRRVWGTALIARFPAVPVAVAGETSGDTPMPPGAARTEETGNART